MRKPETTGTDTLTEARKGYFLDALRELHERHPDRKFELTEVARHASRLDPDYNPYTRFERLLTWFGVERALPDSETRSERERAYLSRGSQAGHIVRELVEAGHVEVLPIAPRLMDDVGPDYGRNANEDGMLYGLSEPVLETVG